MNSGQLIEKLAAIFALIVLIGGSLLVLAPFTTALLWGAILAFSSWYPYSVLSRWIEGAVVPTAESERLIARYLHAHYGRETLLVDIGANSTSLFLANATRDDAVVLGGIGLGYGVTNLLAERGAANVLRWLPFEMSEGELHDWVLNKVVRPLALPQTARYLAVEHAPKIRCNCLFPGPIDTPMVGEMTDERRAWAAENIPLGRWGEPEDVARMALFLASDDASFITAAMFVVDGGYTAI